MAVNGDISWGTIRRRPATIRRSVAHQGVVLNRVHRPFASTRLAVALCVALVVLLLPASRAWAHNALRESTPAQGSQSASAPAQVELVFAERLDPKFTTVAVTGTGGTTVTAGKPAVAGTRATQPLTAGLAAGSYTVAYRVVSVDGHPVQGSFTFTITAPPGAAPASAAPTSAPAPASTSAASSPSPVAVGNLIDGGARTALIVAAVALVAAGLALLLWRARAGRR